MLESKDKVLSGFVKGKMEKISTPNQKNVENYVSSCNIMSYVAMWINCL